MFSLHFECLEHSYDAPERTLDVSFGASSRLTDKKWSGPGSLVPLQGRSSQVGRLAPAPTRPSCPDKAAGRVALGQGRG